MNGKSVLFKTVAVVSALAIGGGYVAWRSGEAAKTRQLVLEREKAREELENIGEEKDMDPPETLLPSSKSIPMPVFSNRKINDPIEIGEDVLLPGSKSSIVIPVEPEPENTEPQR